MTFNNQGSRHGLRDLLPFNERIFKGVVRPNGNYEVYSYATKIAVMDREGRVSILDPADSPTRTTTRHRNLVESVWRDGPGYGSVFEVMRRGMADGAGEARG